MVVERKLVPLMVNVSGPEPAFALVGLIEVTVGAGGVVLPEPEVDALPAQPERMAETRMQGKTSNNFWDFIATKCSAEFQYSEAKFIETI